MSVETKSEPKKPQLSANKLDALRDILSNHKTIKIKPVNVELRQQLAAMKLRYEMSMKEKEEATKRNIQESPLNTSPEEEVKIESLEQPGKKSEEN